MSKRKRRVVDMPNYSKPSLPMPASSLQGYRLDPTSMKNHLPEFLNTVGDQYRNQPVIVAGGDTLQSQTLVSQFGIRGFHATLDPSRLQMAPLADFKLPVIAVEEP